MKWLSCILLILLCGCASTSKQVMPVQHKIDGWVHLEDKLFKTAVIELTLFSLIDGKPRKVAQQRFSVQLLPLAYSFSLPPVSYGNGQLYLLAQLRWDGESSVQADFQQKIITTKPGSSNTLTLKKRLCFPYCK